MLKMTLWTLFWRLQSKAVFEVSQDGIDRRDPRAHLVPFPHSMDMEAKVKKG